MHTPQLLVEEYRTSAHRLLAELNISQDVKNEQKILDFIARVQKEQPPTKREIPRATGIKNRKEVYAAVDALVDSGTIEAVDRNNSRGRNATAYVTPEYCRLFRQWVCHNVTFWHFGKWHFHCYS